MRLWSRVHVHTFPLSSGCSDILFDMIIVMLSSSGSIFTTVDLRCSVVVMMYVVLYFGFGPSCIAAISCHLDSLWDFCVVISSTQLYEQPL